MKIRTKLSLTFISLLIFGVTAVSSYAIMFIRNYLLQEGQQTIQEQARWLALTIQEFPRDGQFMTRLNTLEEVSGYEITVYDGDGVVVYGEGGALLDDRDALLTDSLQMQVYMGDAALINERSNEGLYVFHSLMSPDLELGFLRVAQLKETIYEPITTIRWIIYSGMFISIAIILLVSTVFLRGICRGLFYDSRTVRSVLQMVIPSILIWMIRVRSTPNLPDPSIIWLISFARIMNDLPLFMRNNRSFFCGYNP